MQRHHTRGDLLDERAGTSGRRALVVVAVLAVLGLAAALHLVGVLPPGG